MTTGPAPAPRPSPRLLVILCAACTAAAHAQTADRRDRERSDREPGAVTNPLPGGFLRPISELRPVGGDLRPVGGNIRPVGGSIGTTGSIRPIEIVSPLANDRSFEARLRPNTTAVGVTGFAIEPGWDDPPWETGGGAPSSAAASEPRSLTRRAAPGARASAGVVVLPGRYAAGAGSTLAARQALMSADAPTDDAPVAAVGAPPAAGRTMNREPASVGPRPREGWDPEWFDAVPFPRSARPAAGDPRPEVRLAVRLSLEGRRRDAVEVLRHAVYQNPEAFSAVHGSMFARDAAADARLAAAIEAWNDPDRRTSADRAFMLAALSAARGPAPAALEAIREARRLGEDRDSGKMLHRVLSRVDDEARPEVRP